MIKDYIAPLNTRFFWGEKTYIFCDNQGNRAVFLGTEDQKLGIMWKALNAIERERESGKQVLGVPQTRFQF